MILKKFDLQFFGGGMRMPDTSPVSGNSQNQYIQLFNNLLPGLQTHVGGWDTENTPTKTANPTQQKNQLLNGLKTHAGGWDTNNTPAKTANSTQQRNPIGNSLLTKTLTDIINSGGGTANPINKFNNQMQTQQNKLRFSLL